MKRKNLILSALPAASTSSVLLAGCGKSDATLSAAAMSEDVEATDNAGTDASSKDSVSETASQAN